MLARSPKKIPANSCPEGKGLAASVCLGDWGWEVDWRNPGMLRAYLLHPPIFIWSPPWILPGHPQFQRPEAPTAARRQVDEWPRTQWTWESWPRSWKRDRWAPPVFRAGSCQGSRSSSSSASGWEEAEARMAAAAELGLTSSWYPTSFCYCKHLGGSIPSTSAEAWKSILRWGQKRGPWIWEVCLSGLGSFLRCLAVASVTGLTGTGGCTSKVGQVGSSPRGLSTASVSLQQGSWLPSDWTAWETVTEAIMPSLT